MIIALRQHWPEYVIEAALLGLFMVSAGLFATIIEHPNSPIRRVLDDALLRRFLMGLAMGLTAVALIYSPWGKRSGAHFNPAVTLAFFRLKKIRTWDAFFYIFFQFIGAAAGVLLVWLLIGNPLSHPLIRFVVTIPGRWGISVAFIAEMVLSFALMFVVLFSTNTKKLASLTGVFAGILLVLYITIEAPISGMSINPARTFGSALAAHLWTGFWIYLLAPPLGMLAAAELRLRTQGAHSVLCAKLHHQNNKRCIFNCGFKQMPHEKQKQWKIEFPSLQSEDLI